MSSVQPCPSQNDHSLLRTLKLKLERNALLEPAAPRPSFGKTVTMELIDHFKLDAEFHEDCVTHSPRFRRSGQAVIEWKRTKAVGNGAFGSVWLEENQKGSLRAVKEIRKLSLSSSRIDYRRELLTFTVMSKYPNHFMQILGWYETEDIVFIATEFFGHGHLHQFLESGACDEEDARMIMSQILEALKIMHDERFTHRNLKPQNIYVLQGPPNWWIKLGGFGISKRVSAEDPTALRTEVGTPRYMAPEVAGFIDEEGEEYTNAVDLWAVGCLAYWLLTAGPPFPYVRFLAAFVRDVSTFPLHQLQMKNASNICIDFIQRTLVALPSHRLTASAAMQHGWLCEIQTRRFHTESPDPEEIDNTMELIKIPTTEDRVNLQPLELKSSLDILTSFMGSVERFKIEVSFQQGFTIENQPHDLESIRWFKQEELGSGLSGEVWLEREFTGRRVRAVKRLKKNAIPELDYRKELFAMVKISEGHLQHFVEFYGWYEDPAEPNSFFIAMEYIKHGDLRKYIQNPDRAPLTEKDGRLISKQLLEGLDIMHSMAFSHRDLNPKNLFVVQRFPTWWIKIGDFGIAKQNTNTSLRTIIGTPSWMAPEITGYVEMESDEYTKICDVWSLGCVVYWLLTEEVPFPDTNPWRLFEFVKDNTTFPAGSLHEKGISTNGIDFLKTMLVAKPDERPSTSVVLKHPWVKDLGLEP